MSSKNAASYLGGDVFSIIEWQLFRHMAKKTQKRGESRFSVMFFPKGGKMPLNNGGIAPGITQVGFFSYTNTTTIIVWWRFK